MSVRREKSLEQRVSELESRLAERDAAVAFMATLNARLAGVVLGLRPFSDCEKKCLKIKDTEKRLNCLLKCVADGK